MRIYYMDFMFLVSELHGNWKTLEQEFTINKIFSTLFVEIRPKRLELSVQDKIWRPA